ncbi:hypothetical protein PENTCL1PPCAC_26983, partial [Pristionchus entomophagus]
MKLDLLIRSRSQITDDYCLHWENSVLSIWSALTNGTIKAAAVEVDAGCRITLHLLDTRASLTKDKGMRVITNNVKAVEVGRHNDNDEDEEGDEGFIKHDSDKESGSKKKKSQEDLPAASVEEGEGTKNDYMEVSGVRATVEENTASNKSAEKGKGEVKVKSKEKSTMKESKDSKVSERETTRMAAPDKEELPKTQDSHSANGNAFSDSVFEQKTQSVKEWPAKGAKEGVKVSKEESHKRERRRKKRGEKEKEKLILKTPDISLRSQHQSLLTMIDPPKTPAMDEGRSGKKKKIEKELEDAKLKSKYEMKDAIAGDDNMSMKKNELHSKSEMKDVSMRKKEGAEK